MDNSTIISPGRALRSVCTVALLILFMQIGFSQSTNLSQSANGPASAPLNPPQWQNGNVNANQAHYVEGQSVAYRQVMTSLPVGVPIKLTMEFDATSNNKIAIDFITRYNRLEPHDQFGHPAEVINPLTGVAGTFAAPTTFPIPAPPQGPSVVTGQPTTAYNAVNAAGEAYMTIYNGTITNIAYTDINGVPSTVDWNNPGTNQALKFTITFTASASDVVIAWGGHISSGQDWGDNSAAGIPGSPYHMRQKDWSLGNLGNTDRALAAGAVVPVGACVVTCPDDFSVSCSDYANNNFTWPVPTYTCINNPNVTTTFTSSTSGTCPLVVTRDYTVTVFSNVIAPVVHHCIVAMSVVDNDPPSITCPGNITVACASDVPAHNISLVTASDNCTPNPVKTFVGDFIHDQTCANSYTITRTYKATDGCGNFSTCSQTINVLDDTAPVLSNTPADASYICYASVPAPAIVLASDNCQGSITPVYSESQSNQGSSCNNTITRTWTATDACGNAASFTQTINVNDNLSPVLSGLPVSEVNVSCYAFVPAVAAVTAQDNCDGTIQAILVSDETNPGSSCNNTITRTWTATDVCGNSTSFTQTINVNDDLDPVLSELPVATVNVTCYADVPAVAAVNAQDNCDGAIAPEFTSEESNEGTSCNNTITRVWTATDACGNSASFTQTIHVNDDVDPVLHNIPADFTAQCGQVPSPGDVYADDNCGGDVIINYSEVSLSDFCPVSILRTWTAYDACGNSATASQTITINDTEDPSLLGVPADDTVECDNVPAPALVTAEDNCASDLQVSFEQSENVELECGYSFTRTWSVSDLCGNSASASQTITVVDTTAPTANLESEEIYVECGSDIPDFNLEWSDNCDANPTQFIDVQVETDGCEQIITETYSAADNCNNGNSVIRTIHIVDTTNPYITHAVEDQFIFCEDEIFWDLPRFDDLCDNDLTITYSVDTTFLSDRYVIHRHFTATDNCGNSVTDDSDIAIATDNDPILFGLPDAYEFNECGTLEEPAIIFGTDFCGNELDVNFTEEITEEGCYMYVLRTWTITDGYGNTTTFTQTIEVGDTTPPTIACPQDLVVTCAGDVPAADVNSIVASDNCGVVTVTFEDVISDFECTNRFIIIRTYTATDECDNSTSCTQFIAVNDEIAPVFTFVHQGTANCGEAIDFGIATALDNCGGEVIITFDDLTEPNDINEHCQYTTYSKGAWGSPSNSSPGDYRDTNFASAFPNGLTIGCATGSFTFTTPEAIMNFIPSGGGSFVLPTGNLVNPSPDGYDNNFADQLMAAMLNVGFDAYDPNFGPSNFNLGDLLFASGPFAGMSANSVIQIANDVIGGCSNAYSPETMKNAMEEINLSFLEGNSNSGALLCHDQGNPDNVCDYSVSRIWTATDACGNTSTAVTTIIIFDTEVPTVVSQPADIIAECGEDVEEIAPVFTDNCDANLLILPASSLIMLEPCGYLIHKSWTAIDACGNETTVSQNITIQDTTDPVLHGVPVDVLAECGQLPAVADVTATDNCGDVTVEFSESGVQDGCYYNLTRTWTATDACGNAVSASQLIVVGDNTAPSIVSAPAEIIYVECNTEVPSLVVGFADNCDTDLDYSEISTIGNITDCGYDISRSITAVDDCGNATSFGQIVQIRDTTDPTIVSSPADQVINCTDEIPAVVEPIFSDNCDDELTILPASSIIELPCGYAIHRTWTATDDCGNSVTASQNITITDNVPPVVNPYEMYVHLECDLVASYVGITATDNCGDVHITFDDVLSSGGCLGTIIRTYHVSDDCGNAVHVQQFIAVQDTHGPVIENPADATVQCDEAPTAIPTINIYDACGLEIEVLEASQTIAVINECTYQIIWHWVAIDYCENVSQATTVITVTDTVNPEFQNFPEDQTISCEVDYSAPATPEVIDNCDDNVEVFASMVIINGDCPSNYDVYYTFRAQDNCLNETIETVVYHIRDLIAPEFSGDNQAQFTFECDEIITLVQPVATDNCSTISYSHEDGFFWSEGCYSGFTRVWTATDACGNSALFFQYINVQDTTPPVIVGEFEIVVTCDTYGGLYITATDNCYEVYIDYVEEHVSGSCAGRYIRTYTVSDDCGNSTEFIQIINVIDVIAPVAVNPISDLTIECGQTYEPYSPEFTDNCDQDLLIEGMSTIAYSEDGCTVYISESYTATDDCNNSTTVGRTITIVDTTAPTFDALPIDRYIDCQDAIETDLVTASDICDDDVTVSSSDAIIGGDCPSSYTIARTWIAADHCGNSVSHVQYIHVTDTTDPEFTFVPETASFNCEDDIDFGVATANDDCSTVEVTHSDVYEYECAHTFTITRTWTATDACGNEATATSTYFVSDLTAPTFDNQPQDVFVQCTSEIPAPAAVTATDNCGTAVVTVEVLEVDADDCGNQILYVQYMAVDDCGNANYTGYYITVNDDTDPELFGCPSNLVLDCYETIPAPAQVVAIDNCNGNLAVSYEEFMFGDLPAEGSIADCNLITPVRPANNPCGYQYDWAMAMFGMPSAHRFYSVSNGNLVQYPNGSVHVTADMHNVQNANNGWHVDVWFNNGMDWAAWSTQGFPTSFKADCGGVASNHNDWMYFILVNGDGAELTGFGSYTGSAINLNHAPANNYFGFQLGSGANNYNNASNGFGGWFSYNGYFQVNNTPYGNNGGNVTGAGDLAFELDCCPQYYVVRQWTASDCSGNSSTCTQTITFNNQGNSNPQMPGQQSKPTMATDVVSTVSLAPNPAIDNTTFSFVPSSKGKSTLEIMSMTGAKVADVFVGTVEAGVEYKVTYNVSQLATGMYMYRLTNGDHTEVGRLIVSK